MARFNQKQPVVRTTPIRSRPSGNARTGNGAPGFVRDPKSELFLLAVGNFVGQDKFYEAALASDKRFLGLVRQVSTLNPAWMARFLPWLRSEATMRTASLIGAAEFAATLAAHGPYQSAIQGAQSRGLGRQTVDAVLLRADEPGEMLAYWKSAHPGKQIPKPIKRGIADAVKRLYNERNALRYDTESKAFRFGDVLELTHPKAGAWYQEPLFRFLLGVRHGRDGLDVSKLPMINANVLLRDYVANGDYEMLLSPVILQGAGMTWEDVLSLAGGKLSKAKLWEAIIPSMGYEALLKNLRNFDEARISFDMVRQVCGRLSDPQEVARSRQLPMRFLSAHRAVSGNLHWGSALEYGLERSLVNVPTFDGSTLILIDTSASMDNPFSKNSELRLWDAAAIFGLALARRCADPTVVSFSTGSRIFPMRHGESLLTALERFRNDFFLGHGTATREAVQCYYDRHDRVIILTDEQADHHDHHDAMDAVPASVPVVTFNLAGYRVGHMESGSATRITIGSLSDRAFKLLPMLEKRSGGQWPF